MSKLSFHFKSLVILAAVSLFAAFPARAQSPQYTVKDLGSFTVRTMNDLGQAAGFMVNKPVLYNNGLLTEITPPAGVSGDAFSINNFGHVAGVVVFCDLVNGSHVNCRVRGFIYRNGSFEVLGTLGGRDSQALGINDSGQVTGWSNPAELPAQAHAFIFQNGSFQDIGIIIGTTSSEARSINAAGQVAGKVSSNTNNGAFFYSNGNTVFFETQGYASDVNSAGQVVGRYGGNDDGSGRAYLFSNGVRQDLGSLTPQHTYNEALAINDRGQVVGISSLSFFTRSDERAFIYSNGVMQDLNSLIPAGSGWFLNVATDINSAGQIVGNGKLNGQDRAFLLTPTEPLLLTDLTNQVIALESVSFLRGPFRPVTSFNLGADQRTRVTLVTRNIDLVSGENIAPPSVQAEDVQHQVFALPVEYAGPIPGAGWLTQIVVRLPDNVTAGDLQITVSFRGRTSGKARLTIAPDVSGGP
jgi:probable HAF family extracellular repeat protein